jgi:hypothetical protein
LTRTDGSFEFDADNVAAFYAYVADPASTATVGMAGGSDGSYFVDAANGGYSYIADPVQGVFSELSGFGSQAVSGAGGSNYAYIYSTSGATVQGDAAGSSIAVGGVTSTFGNFSQMYVVGASDGSDQITLHSEGGAFVGTPNFSYVSGTFGGSSFLIGALYGANVAGVQAGTSDTATFYSYPGNNFDGNVTGVNSLSGTATGADGSSYQFTTGVTNYDSVAVFESGTGTDSVNLDSAPGGDVFTNTPTVSSLTGGGMTITVNTFMINGSQQFIAVPGQIAVITNDIADNSGDSGDTFNLYDSAGANAIVAAGSKAVYTNALSSVTLDLNPSSVVAAYQQDGDDDVLNIGAIDFALQGVGDWTTG